MINLRSLVRLKNVIPLRFITLISHIITVVLVIQESEEITGGRTIQSFMASLTIILAGCILELVCFLSGLTIFAYWQSVFSIFCHSLAALITVNYSAWKPQYY